MAIYAEPGIVNRGAWVSGATYLVSDLVFVGSEAFLALAQVSSNVSPPSDPTNWQPVGSAASVQPQVFSCVRVSSTVYDVVGAMVGQPYRVFRNGVQLVAGSGNDFTYSNPAIMFNFQVQTDDTIWVEGYPA